MKVDFESLIIYEDNHLLVINKPAGLLSQADHTKDVDVTVLAKAYLKDKYAKDGNVYFIKEGYTIHLGEQLLKTIKKIEASRKN